MMGRALVLWCALLASAFANGTIRVLWIVPRAGEVAGHIISCLTLSAAILVVTWAGIRSLGPTSPADALRIGLLWLGLTLAFEFLGGHFLFGKDWDTLVADYNVVRGRLWILVLIATALAPLVGAKLRGLPRF